MNFFHCMPMDNIKFIAVKVMDDEDTGTLGRPVWTME